MQKNWKNKILLIWFGQSISQLTSAIFQMCVVWYLTEKTGSAIVLTFAVISAYVPQAIIGFFTGVLVDRFDKKKIIIISDLFVAVTSLYLAIIATTGELPVYLIYLVLALRSVGTALHEPATKALTPTIVPDVELVKYAGYAQTFSVICTLISPGAALLLNNYFDLSAVVFLDVIGALIAVAILIPIKLQKQAIKKKKIHLINDFKEGFLVLKSIKGLLSLLVVAVLYCFVYAPIGTLYPHIAMVHFGSGTQEAAAVEMLSAIGSLLGSLLLGYFGAKINKFRGLWLAILGYGLGLFAIGLLPRTGIWFFAVISFLMGLTIPVYYGIKTAIYQLKVPEEYLGRAFTLSEGMIDLTMPVGLLLGGQVADLVGVDVLCLTLGGACIVLAFCTSKMKSIKQCCEE